MATQDCQSHFKKVGCVMVIRFYYAFFLFLDFIIFLFFSWGICIWSWKILKLVIKILSSKIGFQELKLPNDYIPRKDRIIVKKMIDRIETIAIVSKWDKK